MLKTKEENRKEIELEFEKRSKRESRRMTIGRVFFEESEFRSRVVTMGLPVIEIDWENKEVKIKCRDKKYSEMGMLKMMEVELTFKNIRDLMKKIS